MGRTVTPDCERPNRMDGTCFFCREPVGGEHKEDCVAYTRKVIVRAVVEYEIDVPNKWDREMIEFSRNESSWCASNMIEELEALTDDECNCLCGCTTFHYVREGGR